MAVTHVLGLAISLVGIVGCMLLPFLPGGYDGLAVALSTMAQLFGIAGLLLVPIAAPWLWHEVARGRDASRRDRGYGFALTANAVSLIVALAVSLGAFIHVGASFALGVLMIWAYGARRRILRARLLRAQPGRPFNAAPLYLLVLPLVALLARSTLVGPAIEFSRMRAMENTAPLIADIERYREANGRYPVSMAALWADYKSGVIGVPQYYYEPSGDAYNVFFEHPSAVFGTREIVVYNTRGEHLFFSHAADRIAVPPRQLRGGGGFYAVRDAGRQHWKRFLFD